MFQAVQSIALLDESLEIWILYYCMPNLQKHYRSKKSQKVTVHKGKCYPQAELASTTNQQKIVSTTFLSLQANICLTNSFVVTSY